MLDFQNVFTMVGPNFGLYCGTILVILDHVHCQRQSTISIKGHRRDADDAFEIVQLQQRLALCSVRDMYICDSASRTYLVVHAPNTHHKPIKTACECDA